MSESKNTTTGVSGTTLLQIAFIVLKLCNVIKWSWWWVMAPTWITIVIALAAGMNEWAWKRRNKKQSEIQKPEINMKSKLQQRIEEMQKVQSGKHDR